MTFERTYDELVLSRIEQCVKRTFLNKHESITKSFLINNKKLAYFRICSIDYPNLKRKIRLYSYITDRDGNEIPGLMAWMNQQSHNVANIGR